MTSPSWLWSPLALALTVGAFGVGGVVAYRTFRHVDHAAAGYAALRAGDNSRAIDELKIAVVTTPDWAENHYNLGVAYENIGWTERALPELERAVQLEPKNETYRQGLAQTQRTLGYRAQIEKRYADAARLYQGVLTVVGDDATTWYNLSLVLQKLSRNDEAEKAIRRANELDPEHKHELPRGS